MSETDATKAERSRSFGGVAAQYERFRPGPSVESVAWFLPRRVSRVVDVGAGTGALTRLLVDRADEVVAVEPDDRMRAVLVERVPGVRAIEGRGEAIPLPDSCADAVLVSSAWHWMEPRTTLQDVARVLVPGGTLGVLWTGPDPNAPFMAQARELLTSRLDAVPAGAVNETSFTLDIPAGLPFTRPENAVFTFDIALNADDLIGLLGTISWIITMPAERRERVFSEARRLLQEVLGVAGDVTVDVAFRVDAWRSQLTA